MKAENIRNALSCGKPVCPCGRPRGNTHCPAHDDPKPSLNVNDADGKTLVHCFGGCTNATVIAALRERELWPQSRRTGTRKKAAEMRWKIKDTAGNVVAVHCRTDKPDGSKDRVWWELPDGTKGLNGKPVETLPLYGCEKLDNLPDHLPVVITEGEKDAESLNGRGIAAVGTVTGASGTPCRESLGVLLQYNVILWPDNDADGKGRKHMERVAQRLTAMGHQDARIVHWTDAPDKGGAADFTGTDDELKALLAAAPRYERPPDMDLAALLSDVLVYIRQYVVMTKAQADAVVLWVAHTHAFDAAETTPYISATSAEKRSGKTRLLEALEPLVARPWFTGRVTAAALYRRIHAERPSLLLDESDSAFKSGEEYAESLRGVLNTGHRRGGATTVCVGQGANITYGVFSTFSPKAIAGIGKLPDTIADRAVSIVLKRRGPGEKVERFKWRRAQGEATPLRDKLEAWANTSVEALAEARPDIPLELDDRAADGWEPLLAIADAAGSEWPQRARSAALALSVGDGRDDDSFGVRLLRDIRAVFDERTEDRITSADLVTALVGLEEGPWGDLRGRPLSPSLLAYRLRPYGIRPKTIRLGDDTAKGYQAEWFADAWTRYCPTPGEPSHPSHPSQTPDTDRADVTAVTAVTAVTGVGEEENGRRHYTLSLAEILDWPAVSLGERKVNNRTVSVGVPATRSAWEQAVRFFQDGVLGELVLRLEEMSK